MRLKDLCEFQTNFPDADFWITRKGNSKTVGTPTKEFKPDNIGVKVVRTDILLPDYLFYVFQYLANEGVFASIAEDGAISINDIKNLQVG
jgi:hypothetical protein